MAKLKGKAKIEFKKKLARGVLKSTKTSPAQKATARKTLRGSSVGKTNPPKLSKSKKSNPKKSNPKGTRSKKKMARGQKIGRAVADQLLLAVKPINVKPGMLLSNYAGGAAYGAYEQATGRLFNMGADALVQATNINPRFRMGVRNALQTGVAALLTLIPFRPLQWLGLNGLTVEGRQMSGDFLKQFQRKNNNQ